MKRQHSGILRKEIEKVMIYELKLDPFYVRKYLKRNLMVQKVMVILQRRNQYKLFGFAMQSNRPDTNLSFLFFNDLEDSIWNELVRGELAGKLIMKLKNLKI